MTVDNATAHPVVVLAQQLVAIDSVNPGLVAGAAGEVAIAGLVADRLDAAGFAVCHVPAPSDPRRVSVVATYDGPRPGRTVVLNGHLDTVGVEGMETPFEPRIVAGGPVSDVGREDSIVDGPASNAGGSIVGAGSGERMLGRGSCDMKGGVAGLIVAAEALAAARAPGRIVLALVADEEDASVGTTAVLDATEMRADVCLIAEPTWLNVAVAHRGFAVMKVRLHGRAVHSSLPAEGVDVLAPLGRLLVGISELDARLRAVPAHPVLDHGSSMATVVRGGSAPFTVAAAAEAVLERRLLPGESAELAVAEVRKLLDPIADVDGLHCSVELIGARDAWESDTSGAAVELTGLLDAALPAAGAAAPRRVGYPYWMESALWQAAGIPSVVCGPAGGGLHAIDEWVDLDQLRRFPVALTTALGRFLASPAGR